MTFKLGQIVKPHLGEEPLRSGASSYGAAIVICAKPFRIVSAEGDMLWSMRKEEEFQTVGFVDAQHFNRVVQRLDPAEQTRLPVGESLGSNLLGCGLTLISMGEETLAVDLNEFGLHDQPNRTFGWEFIFKDDVWTTGRQFTKDELERVRHLALSGFVMVKRSHYPQVSAMQLILRPFDDPATGAPPGVGQHNAS